MCSCNHLYNFVWLKNSISITKKSRATMIMIFNCQHTIYVVGGGALKIIIIIYPKFYICWEELILSNPNTIFILSDFLLTSIPSGKDHKPWWWYLISNNCFYKHFFMNNNLAMAKRQTSEKNTNIILGLPINSSQIDHLIQWQCCICTYA